MKNCVGFIRNIFRSIVGSSILTRDIGNSKRIPDGRAIIKHIYFIF